MEEQREEGRPQLSLSACCACAENRLFHRCKSQTWNYAKSNSTLFKRPSLLKPGEASWLVDLPCFQRDVRPQRRPTASWPCHAPTCKPHARHLCSRPCLCLEVLANIRHSSHTIIADGVNDGEVLVQAWHRGQTRAKGSGQHPVHGSACC